MYRVLLFALPLFWACDFQSEDERRAHVFIEQVALTDSTGFFRGYTLGLEPAQILEAEDWEPEVSTDTLIVFKQDITVKKEMYKLDSFLAFDAFGLFEIQVDIYPPDSAAFDEIYDEFDGKFNEYFGESEVIGDQAEIWTTFSSSNNIVEVTLSRERVNGKEIISVNYLEPLDDEF